MLRTMTRTSFLAVLLCSFPLGLWSQNLLQNPGFEKPANGVPPGTPVAYTDFCAEGDSAAADWTVFVNSCGSEISTTLVPSTAPGGGKYMLHVVTSGAGNGIEQAGTFSEPNTLSSISVYVNSGCIGMGTGDGGNTSDTDEMTCLTRHWIRFYQVPNDNTPSTEFIVYSIPSPDGNPAADFYVDNASVVAAPAP